MKKSDLKTGMFGVMSDGSRFVIVDDKLVYNFGGHDFISELNDDLSFSNHRIDFIAYASGFGDLDWIMDNKTSRFFPVLFDRLETETVMTIAEIEKKIRC